MKKYGFIFLTLTLVFLFQCARERVQPFSAAMKKELSCLPASSDIIGYANIKSFQQSAFLEIITKSWEEEHPHKKDFQEFLEQTGINFKEDVDELFLSVTLPPEANKPQMLLVIKGAFDKNKILNYLSEKHPDLPQKSDTYQNQVLYWYDEKKPVLCFMETNRLLLGNREMVKSWLDHYFAPEEFQEEENEIFKQIRTIKYKTGSWMVVNAQPFVERITRKIESHPEIKRLQGLKAIQKIQFSLKTEDEFYFQGLGAFSDAEKAELFHDAIKGFLATAKLSLSDDRQAVDILNKVKIKTAGPHVQVNFKMTPNDLNKLLEHHRQLQHHRPV
ncbi:MAG: hypothetical protein Kow0042_02830 [Calditrichia bacterium]